MRQPLRRTQPAKGAKGSTSSGLKRNGLRSTINKAAAPVIETVDANIDPKVFFEQYVAKRRPVKFSGIISDFAGRNKWRDSNYLRETAGSCEVKVEHRADDSQRFGKGQEIRTTFGQVLDWIESEKGTQYYLTTQDLDYSVEGQPSIISAPLTHLTKDFKMQPQLTGNLVPQNLNIWIGKSTRVASTTGLHHDFHDNIYILLKGEKTFRLFDFNEYDNLYTVGEVAKVHPNGRINYTGELTNADGSSLASQAAFEASKSLERAALKLNDDSDAEDEIDAALEAVLDAEMAEDDFDDFEDDFVDSDEEGEGDVGSAGSGDGECPSKKQRIEDIEPSQTAKSAPQNFSRVDTSLPMSEIAKRFPKYVKNLHKCTEVTIKAGEMLYLPAGWFHEVHSKSTDDDCHIAFNYWFHPPDNSEFERPYKCEFWGNDWTNRPESKL